jgi:hypothetical protein
MSDLEKINLQLLLDVESFGEQISLLGIDKNTFVPYTTLLTVVKNNHKKE